MSLKSTPFTGARTEEQGILKNIRQVGSIGHFICGLCVLYSLVVGVLGYFAIFTKLEFALFKHPIAGPWGAMLWDEGLLGPGDSALKAFTLSLNLVFLLAGMYFMDGVFLAFTKGELFTKAVHRNVFFFGCWCLVLGLRGELCWILVGFFLMALGWVMRLASALKEDQNFTI